MAAGHPQDERGGRFKSSMIALVAGACNALNLASFWSFRFMWSCCMQRPNTTAIVPRLKSDIVRSLEDATRNFSALLKRDFCHEIARNPRDFKKQVLRLMRRELPPRRGRPNSPQIEAALAMMHQGKTVCEILRAQVRGLDELDTYGRMLAEKALRQALIRRRGPSSG